MSRWQPFSDPELLELWDGLTTDDDLRYVILSDDQPRRTLVLGIAVEAKRRGLVLPEWERVLG